jgi:hypothetical protein
MDVLPVRIINALLKADRENACTIEHFNSAALEIRLRRRASFREKPASIDRKIFNKKGRWKAPFSIVS